MIVCRQWIVRGRVQGVGYRAATRQQAQLLGLCGHAYNRPDGAVEVLGYGTAVALEALELWLWQGPSAAQVQSVTLDDRPASPPPRGFTLG
jgi:acylphosphatase